MLKEPDSFTLSDRREKTKETNAGKKEEMYMPF